MNTDKRQRIMKAAEQLFQTRQFHEITLDDIAAQAGIGKGTIYLYFPDKNELFFQTAIAGFEEMCALLLEHGPDGETFRDTLIRSCGTIRGFFRQRRPLFRLILTQGDHALQCGGSLRERWVDHRRKMRDAVTAIIERGVRSGDIRAALPADMLAIYFIDMLRTRAWELEDHPSQCTSDGSVVDLFLHGAANPAQPAAPLNQ